ncbi:unnamed protein product [Gordionus sp. m RMFG-2023]
MNTSGTNKRGTVESGHIRYISTSALAGLPKESVANTIRIPLSETGDKASTSGIRQQAHSRTSSEVQRMEELMLGQSDDENKNSDHPLGKD